MPITVQTHEEIISLVRQQERQLVALGVRHIFLFGSWAKQCARPDSDIDLLADFDETGDLAQVKNFLQALVVNEIDLVRRSNLTMPWQNEIIATAIKII